MELKEMTLDMLQELREELVGRYIGTWDKPEWYYRKLEAIDLEIKSRS